MSQTKSILLLLLLILLQSTPIVLAQQQGSGTLPPLFDYESRQDFNPDINPMLKPPIDLKVPQELYKVKDSKPKEVKDNKPKEIAPPEIKTVEKKPLPEEKPALVADKKEVKYKPEDFKFQIANPKDVYLPAVKEEKPVTTAKPEVAKVEEKPKTEDNKPKTFQEDSKITNKEEQKPVKEKLSITPKTEPKEPLENKEPKTSDKTKSPDKTSEVSINNLIKKPEGIKILPPAPEIEDKPTLETTPKITEEPEKVDKTSQPENPVETTKSETSPPVPEDNVKTSDVKVPEVPEGDGTKKPEQDGNIDFYLKKYESTLQAQANMNDFKYSLLEPFKQSLFYKVLTDNKYENIEFQTQDVTAESQPEGIVSYNIPLGAEGEYACQIMVLRPDGPDLTKMWVSEQIPGEMDTVMVQDVNNDGQNDIIAVSTTGGVSLLKSIRVYSYDRSKSTFQTVFAMNGIMEGIVNVKPGKILISETFPGGINRAALYVWNGKRFERLEL